MNVRLPKKEWSSYQLALRVLRHLRPRFKPDTARKVARVRALAREIRAHRGEERRVN